VKSDRRLQKRVAAAEAAVAVVVAVVRLAAQPLQQAVEVVADVVVRRRLAQPLRLVDAVLLPQQPENLRQRLRFLPFLRQQQMAQPLRVVEADAAARRLQPAVVEAVLLPRQAARPQVVAVVVAERQQLQQVRRFN
jgi:hypothetical protein